MSKEKKAFASADIVCPDCGNHLHVDIHRKRMNPVEPAIYEIDAMVESKEGMFSADVEASEKKKGKK